MSDSVGKSLTSLMWNRVFVHALNTVKRIPRTGSPRPPPADRLKLYGLYKQSMEGDVEGVMRRPEGKGADETAEREKWDAWSAQHGVSRTEAKRRYINTLIETMHKYASTTTEARELVAELEFVWDQIKSNSTSSSASHSPDQNLRRSTRPPQQGQQQLLPSYAGPGTAERKAGRESDISGLRVMRPFSEVDDDEEDDDNDEEEKEGENIDNFQEAQNNLSPPPNPTNNQSIPHPTTDLDVRNRKWRKRIEQALFKMTTEVAALREQMESMRSPENFYNGLRSGRRKGAWGWMLWVLWGAVKHLVVDAVILVLVGLWARRKGDRRLEAGFAVLMRMLTERVRRVRVLKMMRIPAM